MMMKSNARQGMKPGSAKAALVLCVILLGLVLSLSRPAHAAEWMGPYLDQVSEWGVMRGDASGNMNEDRQITRAEFVTLVNRAFGYTDVGPNPFADVLPSDWFEEDIRIAHQAGYFNGTSANTASPRSLVTREQAAAFLGRCLRLQGTTGAGTSFQDGYQITPQFRGLVQEAAELGIIQGYTDGAFRPKDNITRGQVACFLVRALGTLVQEPGERISGGVYGNLTINTPGVKLKDTVITGNLYLTGGVGLGNVELENVTVMGKIVACGGGQAEKGANSIVLRNVTADSLEVDSLTDQFLSIRSEGLTNIADTVIRTSAYVEDVTDDGLGLRFISLEGDDGAQLQLAGNIKEVINRTPNSTLQMAQGLAGVVTMDEKAVGASLSIDNRAGIKQLNLDTAIPVTGTGSVSNMNVNAAGSSSTMLPDNISVRPGITSNIHGEVMDTVAAAESSEDPRLLTGYPVARNVAPTSADAVFSTNKRGTIYWALTALSDGSVGEDDLVRPPANSTKIIRSGTLNATASNTEFTARLTGLTRDGSYYVSAILVDGRGRRSPVKVTAFTTPDDTVPNFATGYPYTILTEGEDGEQVIQVMAMPTKDCQMYYALLPNNAVAPTPADFKAGSITGNLGYGIVDVKKNTPYLVPRVNTSYLAEQTTYSLYLWLNDADNGKSSSVRRIQVTTQDKTPPTITHLTFLDATARSATFSFALDEPGTLYWAVVKRGSQFYATIADGTANGRVPDPEELVAKIQVENGTGALRRGSANAGAAATDVRFNITGLEGQTIYDLYFVAKDRAGNYNVYTQELKPPIQFSTLDNEPPTVKQEFTHDGTEYREDGTAVTLTPYPDTSIRLVFSESVQGLEYINGQPQYHKFMELYQEVQKAPAGSELRTAAENNLAEALSKHIKLWYRPASGQPAVVTERNAAFDEEVAAGRADAEDWVIDFRKATVTLDPSGTGEMIITLPYNDDLTRSGLNLDSGVTYYFTLENIADTSAAANRMAGNRGITTLQSFTTIDAQLVFSKGTGSGNVPDGSGGTVNRIFDMNFRLSPVTTANVNAETVWDMIFWSSNTMTFQLYSRELGDSVWELMGEATFSPTSLDPTVGISISREMLTEGDKNYPHFDPLRSVDTDREYGIYVTSLNGSSNREEWSGTGSITIVPVAGDEGSMRTLVNGSLTPSAYQTHQNGINAVKEIGVPKEYTVTCPFRDTAAPTFIEGQPTFNPSDTGVSMNIMLSRSGRYYYVIAPAGYIPTAIRKDGQEINITAANWDQLPKNGEDFDGRIDPDVTGNAIRPTNDAIARPTFSGSNYQMGSGNSTGAFMTIPVTGLLADTDYVAYFVLQGESTESISSVYAFGFHTDVVSRPVLRATLNNPSATVESLGESTATSATPKDAIVSYMVINSLQLGPYLGETVSSFWDDSYAKTAGLSDSQIASAKATYGNYTLVEAMATQYSSNNRNYGSVFDLFTSAAIQDQVSSWFQTAQTSGTTILKVGIETEDLNSRTRWRSTINCRTELAGKSGQYWFVAIGRSPLGSAYAFTAARYLSNPNVTHPMVTALNFEYDRTQSPSQPNVGDAANQSYSGVLTITFDGPLYFADNGVLKQVVDTSADVGIHGNYIKSSLICTPPYNIQLTPVHNDASSTPTCESLSFQVTNAFQGATINFSQFLANSMGQYGERGLALKLGVARDTNGLYGAEFQIDTDGWDARR